MDKVLVRTQASKHHVFSFVDTGNVFDQKLIVFSTNKYDQFAILSSCHHEIWLWKYKADLGETPNYSPSRIFQTFPFPNYINELDLIGVEYNIHRDKLMLLVNLGLTKTYNLFHSQYLTSVDIENQSKQPREVCEQALQDILKLRALHVQMDQAVLEAYGWQNIQLRHNFYEVDYLPENDRVRYTIHPEARKEILKRLLELNHKIHEEEVKAGLWDKKKYKIEKKKSGVEEKKTQYGLGI